MAKRKTVSLVLGSGGARGLAHIGVIDAIEAGGLEIRSIAGSSMGALIGGIYAMGKLDDYRRWVCALQRTDVMRLLDLSLGSNGLIKGERIIEVLKDLIGEADIGDLPIRFTAVATDVDAEKAHWFTSGLLFDAIRASIAIPTIFTPYSYQGRHYLDGGLTSPLPVEATADDDTDLTIVVSLSARPQAAIKVEPMAVNGKQQKIYHRLIAQFIEGWMKQATPADDASRLGLLDVFVRSMNIMENTIAQNQLAACRPDLVIEIPRNVCSFYEFHRARELIEIGRRITAQQLTASLPG